MISSKMKLKDFVVLDIENPNTKANSICSISFIQVKDGNIIKEEYTLINPEDKFDDINMRINKITPVMVKDAITFDKFWEKNREILENNIIVGHGIKYDLSVITKTLMKYNISLPVLKVICTQKLVQKYLDIKHYKLDFVCDYLKIDLERHHDALCDSKACLNIFNYINENYGLSDVDIEKYKFTEIKNRTHGMKINYSDDTKTLKILKNIVESIMKDKKIELDEVYSLNDWLNDNTQLVGIYPFDKINNIVKNVLTDEIITPKEFNELMKVFNQFLDPVKENNNSIDSIDFYEKTFCLTGTFNSGSKAEIQNKIINKDGICIKGVNSKLNYLVVGDAGSDAWKFGNYGGKIQKAMELKEKGKDIQIIEESELIKYL